MKVFFDDLRDPPDNTWMVSRSFDHAIRLLSTIVATHISLDHDMGEGERSGYELLCWIEERVFVDGWPMPEITVHSQNPSGRAKMELTIRRMKERLG